MGTKTLIRLLIALAVIGGLAAILHYTGNGGGISEIPSKGNTKSKKVFDGFPINDVAKISIVSKEASVNVEKGETSWQVAERDGYPADTEPIAKMLKDIWDLKVVQPVTIGRSQYGRLNLVEPTEAPSVEESATILKFLDGEGKDLASLWLGKVYEKSENRPNPFGGGMATSEAGRYVKTGSSNSVYLVGETFSSIETLPAAWIDKTFFKVDGVKSIAIDRGDAEKDWKLTREGKDADFTLAGAKKEEQLDASKTASMKSAFSNPQVEDVFTGSALEANKTDGARFVVDTFDGFHYEISVGEKNDINELPLTMKVSAKFVEKRKEGEEESEEEKARLDKEFEENLNALKEKLNREKQLEGKTFKIRSYIVDPITKDRSELLQVEEAPAEGEEIAPGIRLPGAPPKP